MGPARGRTACLLPLGLVLSAAATIADEARAQRLGADDISYLGSFEPPSSTDEAPSRTWSWGMRGLTMIPDCLGRPDPSPKDGYPGCIGGFGHDHAGLFGVFDLVPPRKGNKRNRAQQVVNFYSLGESVPATSVKDLGMARYWDVLYDRGASHCRLWWTFGSWYQEIANDLPFLGFSSCDPESPRPQGMWKFGRKRSHKKESPFHSAKYYRNLSRIAPGVADRHFGGRQMMLGTSFKGGTLGGAQGPTAYVRPLEVPKGNPSNDLVPLLWYRFTAYVKWYDKPEMNGGAMRHWTQADSNGVEWVSSPQGEAAVVVWQTPIINPDDYPCSHPTAYRDDDPTTPEPCKVPVCWYGLRRCEEGGHADFQQPSFWEDTTTGKPMPTDCNLEVSGDYTGPHCLSVRPFLLLYDLDDLAAVYRGEMKHNQPQPYAAVPVARYLRGQQGVGSTYNPRMRRLYVSAGRDAPLVHVFAIGSEVETPRSESGAPLERSSVGID